jgi:ABC-type lipoprotein release transport system permease subunit
MAVGGGGFLIGNTIYARLTPEDALNLSVMAFVITLLAGLFPAMMAARLEPVEALRAEK